MKEYLIKQIEEKRMLEKNNRFRIIKEDKKNNDYVTNSIIKEKEEEFEKKKKIVEEYKQYLDDQVKNVKKEVFMSDVEKNLNKKLLEKIQ